MNSKERNPIALVIIPPFARSTVLFDMYQGLVDSIEKWHKEVKSADGSEIGPGISYCSLYADPLVDDSLFLLDSEKQVVKFAVASARQTFNPWFLSFGLSEETNLGIIDWKTSDQEGWGILSDPEGNSKYIGDVRDSLPHGSSLMEYANGTSYEGSWFQGNRDGYGRLRGTGGKVLEEGIFVDNVRQENSLLVNVTVYDNAAPSIRRPSPVLCHLPQTITIREIEPFIPAQVEKFAKASDGRPANDIV